jgi:AcrR family transcriptional regulator
VGRRVTVRGRETRSRILDAAATLIYANGVTRTTLDDVREASGASKSQIYHHYRDKEALVRDVVALQGSRILAREHDRLDRVTTLAGLTKWRTALVKSNDVQHGAYGCALGALASELADHDREARAALNTLFAEWGELLAAALQRIQDHGNLSVDADVSSLAVTLLAALQGGYLLAQAAGKAEPMSVALDTVLAHIRLYAP